MICLLTIDCWDTILENTEVWDSLLESVFQRVLDSHGIGVTGLALSTAFGNEAANFTETLSTKLITIPVRERIARLAHYVNLRLPDSIVNELCEEFENIILAPLPHLKQGAASFLRQVHRANIKLCLVCNTGWFSSRAIMKALESHGVSKYFDSFVFSDDVGVAKPSSRIFEIALARFDCPRDDVFHIGDNLTKDVLGATKAGLHSIHFHPGGKCAGLTVQCASNYSDIWTILAQHGSSTHKNEGIC